MAQVSQPLDTSGRPSQGFRAVFKEWIKDHRMFAATLEELAGQLAILEPRPNSSTGAADTSGSGSGSSRSGSKDGSNSKAQSELLQRVYSRAPSDVLKAYMDGQQRPARLQRHLPQQLDDNLRLLGILAAEMRRFLQQMEGLADAEAAAGLGGGVGQGTECAGGDEALLFAAVLDGAAQETLAIEKAAQGIGLTTPAEEVSAAATILRLQPFLSDALLAALQAEA